MLIHDGDRIGENLRGGLAVPIFLRGELRLVVAQLIEQAIPQVAAGNSGWIHLAHQFEGLVQISQIETGLKLRLATFADRTGSGGCTMLAAGATASGRRRSRGSVGDGDSCAWYGVIKIGPSDASSDVGSTSSTGDSGSPRSRPARERQLP